MQKLKSWWYIQSIKLRNFDHEAKMQHHWYAQLRHPIYYGGIALKWRINKQRREHAWLNNAIFKAQITYCNIFGHKLVAEQVKYTSFQSTKCKRCGIYKSDQNSHFVMTHLSGDWSAHKCDIKGRPL